MVVLVEVVVAVFQSEQVVQEVQVVDMQNLMLVQFLQQQEIPLQ